MKLNVSMQNLLQKILNIKFEFYRLKSFLMRS